MAHGVGSLRRTDSVAIEGIADIRRSLAARRSDANDPLQTSGASLRSRPRSISGEGGGDPKSRNLIEKCSLRLVARNTGYMLRLLTPCRPLHRCFPHQEAAIWIP